MKFLKPFKLFRHVLKLIHLPKGRVLGLDVGDEHVGFALSDVHNEISEFSDLFHKKKDIDLIADGFQSMISQHSIVGVVIGYPLDKPEMMSHCLFNDRVVQMKVFIEDLNKPKKLEDLKYTLFDDIWSKMLIDRYMDCFKSPKLVHTIAAAKMLQYYLDFVNANQTRTPQEEED